MKYKDLVIALKRGVTSKELMERYEFKSEEELQAWIKKISPVKYPELFRQLRRNDKRTVTSGESSSKNLIELAAEMLAEIELAAVEEEKTETEVTVEQELKTETEVEIKAEEVPQLSELQQLQKDEEEVSSFICTLECKHKACMQERRQIVATLNLKKQELETLLQKIKECEKTVTEKYENYTRLAGEMQNLDGEIQSYRVFLQQIRGRIEELKKVIILVSKDSIELENQELPKISFEEMNVELEKLLKMEEADELTLKELKTLAKLFLIVRTFDKYEVCFDSLKMEDIFKKLQNTLA